MATLNEMKASLQGLYKELEAGQTKMSAGEITAAEGEALEGKAKEAETLQGEIEKLDAQFARLKPLAAKAREIPEPALPRTTGAARPGEQKAGAPGLGADGSPIVGYVSIGDAFVNSPEFKAYMDAGMQERSVSAPVFFKGIDAPHLEITQKMLETKAVPSFGAGVIQADRVGLVARDTMPDRLRIRDVLNVSQTSAPSVEYLTEDAIPESAANVAEGASKPETTAVWSLATSPVRTVAVWQPVTEQQLQDVAQITNLINTRLLYQLKKQEEKQFMYGSGAGQNLQGILTLAGVPLITRTVTSTTNIDRVRIGITDVLVAGYEPNALTVHPIDWEAIVLSKGTDNKYIWTLVTDPQTGNSRLWGLTVVESVAMKNPANLQRYFLVGDFRMGATVWDRQQANVQVGWVNDQFITNQRTIRAEERLAFGVHSPKAFAKYETATAT